MGEIVQLIFSILAVIAGLFFGRQAERKHYESIRLREAKYLHLAVRADGRFENSASDAKLVVGTVVIANDRFKALVGSIQSFFGGNMHSFESLIDRGRREAVLRLKAQAADWGATEVLHLRLESNSIDGLGVEILATGTAVK